MNSSDGRQIFDVLMQGELIDAHAEQYLRVVVSEEIDIYNLPGVRFKRVDDGTLNFIMQAHHNEVLARYGHALKKEGDTTRVVGRFVLYLVEQYLRLGTSATPIGNIEINEEGVVGSDGKVFRPWPCGIAERAAALRNGLVAILQRSLEE